MSMEFYQLFTFAVVAYCVVRSLSAGKNPIFWGVFAFVLPWAAIIVIHFFIGKKDENANTGKGGSRQGSWEKIKKELQDRSQKNKNQTTYETPQARKEAIFQKNKKPKKGIALQDYELPSGKTKETEDSKVVYDMPVFDKKPYGREDEIVEEDIMIPEVAELPEIEAPVYTGIELPEIQITEELYQWKEEEKPVEAILELKEIQVEAPLDLGETEDGKEEKKEAILEVVEVLEEQKAEEANPLLSIDYPIQLKSCIIRSHKQSRSGMNVVKYAKDCNECDWKDRKTFTFMFHESEAKKEDHFICPKCLADNELLISVTLEEESAVL